MLMHVGMPAAFLLTPDKDAQMRPDHAALLTAPGGIGHPGDPQRVQLGEDGLPVVKELQKTGGEHIARRAHGAVKMQDRHGFFSIWLIRLAR